MTSDKQLTSKIATAASKEAESPALSDESAPDLSVDLLVEDPATEDLSIDLSEYKLAYGINIHKQENVHEIEQVKQKLKETKDTHDLRLKYANRIFVLICVWLVFVALLVIVSGCVIIPEFPFYEFNLSDQVLIAFITSTTITVVGLFVVVAKWMFPDGNSKKSS